VSREVGERQETEGEAEGEGEGYVGVQGGIGRSGRARADSTSFHFQRAPSALTRSLARSLIRFVRFVRSHSRSFMRPAASSTKIGNAAVFAKRPGPLGCSRYPAREFRGDEIPARD